MTEEKAKQLVKTIIIFAALFIVVLLVIVLVQTFKIHSSKNHILSTEEKITKTEYQNRKDEEFIDYLQDENGELKQEFIDEYGIFEEGLNVDGKTTIYI